MSAEMIASKHRIGYIDGLRAVAVLCVVAFHTAKYGGLERFFGWGTHGVELFFVLSGFCLAYPTLHRLSGGANASFDVVNFGSKRIVRIVPPYYAAIALFLLFVLAAKLLGTALPSPVMLPYGFSTVEILKQILFIDHQTSFLNGSFWTLCVEFRWYFFFPIALWLWIKAPRGFWAVALMGVPLYLLSRANIVDFATLPAFMLGIVAAHIQIRSDRIQWFAIPLALIALAVGLTWTQRWGGASPVWTLAAFFIVVAAGFVRPISRVLETKWAVAIGVASYSIYLVHEPLIAMMEQHRVPALAAAIVSVAFGFAFWWIAERPFVETKIRTSLVSFLTTAFHKMAFTSGITGVLRMSGHAAPDRSEFGEPAVRSHFEPTSRPPTESATGSKALR